MALGIVLLRTEYRASLEDTVKHAYHHLLIELGALCQHSRAVEIIQTEQVGTALSALGSELRGMNFCEALAVKEIPEGSYHALLNPELCTLSYVPKGNRSAVQLGVQGSVQLPFSNRQRHGRSRLRQYGDAGQSKLHAVRGALLFVNRSLCHDTGRLFQCLQVKGCHAFLKYTL